MLCGVGFVHFHGAVLDWERGYGAFAEPGVGTGTGGRLPPDGHPLSTLHSR